jgi:4-hydroxy-3-polyprenylbenzoate decarboxylase
MKRIIVAITGASGVIYGIRMLEALKGNVETHLILSEMAQRTLSLETAYDLRQVESLAQFVYDSRDLSSSLSSGSFRTDGMVILPCSIKTLSAVAHSYNENLIVRAADVTLKERRKLIMAVRECPLHTGHLRLMLRVSEMGGIIFPPVPAFYHHPSTLDDIIHHTIGKILDLLDIEHTLFRRWEGK